MSLLGDEISTPKRGEDSWTVRNLEVDLYVLTSPVVHNGLHYYLSENRNIVVLHLQGIFHCKTWVSKLIRPPDCCFSEEDFLVKIDGVPALVIAPADGQIRVFQWNKAKKDWRILDCVDFDNKELFLSRRSWLLEKIDGGGMGNTIFFPYLIDDDNDDGANDGVFYSFATRRNHSFYSGYSGARPYVAGKPVVCLS